MYADSVSSLPFKFPKSFSFRSSTIVQVREFLRVIFGKTFGLFEENPPFFGVWKELFVDGILRKFVAMQMFSGTAGAFTRFGLGKSMDTFQILLPFVAPANKV